MAETAQDAEQLTGHPAGQAPEYSGYGHDAVKHLLLSQRTPPQNIIPLDPDFMPGIIDRGIASGGLNRQDALLTGGAL